MSVPPLPAPVEDFERLVRRRYGMSMRDLELIGTFGGELRARGWAVRSVLRAGGRVSAFARSTSARGHTLLTASKPDIVAFANKRAEARALPLFDLLCTKGWRGTINAIKLFYRSAEARGFIAHSANPVRGIFTPPPRASVTVAVGPKQARYYEQILRCPSLSDCDRSVLLLLSHGLTPQEICGCSSKTWTPPATR